MKNIRKKGPLSYRINQHLELRRSLGCQDIGTRLTLYRFETFLSDTFPASKIVTRQIILRYLKEISHLHPRTRRNHLLYIRQFCRFLFQQGLKTYIPEKGLLPPGRTSIRPHIYTKAEVISIGKYALELRQKNRNDLLRPHTYATLFQLLWVSGLRIGEALRLNIEDINLEQSVLHIRQTKFGKSRFVPISKSTIKALKQYLILRNSHDSNSKPSAPVFMNSRMKRCSIQNVYLSFKKIIARSGIKTFQGGKPRIHDFRHSFATHWLADFYRLKKDPTASLPSLATYLGHVNLAATQVYLHPSLNLLEYAGRKVAENIKCNLGEVS